MNPSGEQCDGGEGITHKKEGGAFNCDVTGESFHIHVFDLE